MNNSENKWTFTEAATFYYCMAMSCGSSVCESVDSEWPPTTATSTTDSTTESTAGSSLLSVLLFPKWKFVVEVCMAANELQSSSAYFAMAAPSMSHYSIHGCIPTPIQKKHSKMRQHFHLCYLPQLHTPLHVH